MASDAQGGGVWPAPKATLCPICGGPGDDDELYPANFRMEDLTPDVFSARRRPDRIHYRMVRCRGCGLVRSNPILPSSELVRLYRASRFRYSEEAGFATRTYGIHLRRALRYLGRWENLLEIGCGNGSFLMEALATGFHEVAGVEPSEDAVRAASPAIRGHIRVGFYDRDMFAAGSFDVICAFQVFDHVEDPAAIVAACRHHLREGGLALFVNHDRAALLNRILGEASPIVDIEHTALFDPATMRRIFEKGGFAVREVFPVTNVYPLAYWLRLAPLPEGPKTALLGAVARSPIGRVGIPLRAGNLGLVAQKA